MFFFNQKRKTWRPSRTQPMWSVHQFQARWVRPLHPCFLCPFTDWHFGKSQNGTLFSLDSAPEKQILCTLRHTKRVLAQQPTCFTGKNIHVFKQLFYCFCGSWQLGFQVSFQATNTLLFKKKKTTTKQSPVHADQALKPQWCSLLMQVCVGVWCPNFAADIFSISTHRNSTVSKHISLLQCTLLFHSRCTHFFFVLLVG